MKAVAWPRTDDAVDPHARSSGGGAARRTRYSTTDDRAKRMLDVAIAGAGLIARAPLLALVAVAIRVGMGPPVLFRQWRPGRFGRPFKLVKFRSLLPEVDEAGQPRAVGARVTTLGSLLRRTSIDELPELWNVLR